MSDKRHFNDIHGALRNKNNESWNCYKKLKDKCSGVFKPTSFTKHKGKIFIKPESDTKNKKRHMFWEAQTQFIHGSLREKYLIPEIQWKNNQKTHVLGGSNPLHSRSIKGQIFESWNSYNNSKNKCSGTRNKFWQQCARRDKKLQSFGVLRPSSFTLVSSHKYLIPDKHHKLLGGGLKANLFTEL